MRRAAAAVIVIGVLGGIAWAAASCHGPATRPAAPPATAAPVRPQPPAAPPARPADATISNAPALAGSVVLDLPPLPAGETRRIVGGDGCFSLDAAGDLTRGFAAIPQPGTRLVTVRQAQGDAPGRDTVYAIAVTVAPWSVDAFPELVVQSFTQESVAAPGPLAQLRSAGLAGRPATAQAGREPVKLAAGAGIAFPAGGRKLAFRTDGDALLLNRWALAVFRVEAGTGKYATLLSINDGPQPAGRSGNWIPRLEVNAVERSAVATYRGTARHQLRSPSGSVAVDGRWNVALTYRRHGRIFLRVNGADCGQASTTEGFSSERPDDMLESRIGDPAGEAAGWALDGLWIGQSELSERTVAKLEAWALGRAAGLPGGAAATAAFRPLIDGDDFPHRYVFDPARWAAWKQANPKEQRLAFQGRPAAEVQPDRSGWVRVFVDDFRAPARPGSRALNRSSVGDSTADADAGRQIWYAPGTNSAVGDKAVCKDGNDRPYAEAYAHDAAAQTLAMRLYCAQPGRWHNAQMSSVNEAGVGYAWAGAKGFRVRAKLVNAGPGLFPCPIWFYNLEHLFWRTGERVEFDIIELDHGWDNYGSSHVHHGAIKGIFGHSAVDTMKKSTVPDELRSPKLAAGKQLCGVDAWDGRFHTWEVWIDEGLTCINVDGLEVARVATAPEYLERLFMYINTSLRDPKGLDESKSYDLVLDSVEGFRPAAAIDAVPGAPFTARPVLSGAAEPGSTITCTANLAGCDDVWYYWHVDGYPRGFGTARTYTVLPEDRGASIRCMVKAAGATDQPEAWTAALPVR